MALCEADKAFIVAIVDGLNETPLGYSEAKERGEEREEEEEREGEGDGEMSWFCWCEGKLLES